jgi:DNA-binding NarL/FixJ family response regulator
MGPTVLIVDDHPSFRAWAKATLDCEGFTVVGEAETGATALAETARLSPDVVLLDVQLPDMTGFEICSTRLSNNPRTPQVVLVSSRDVADYGSLVTDCGARGFVAKDELTGAAVEALLG